MNEIWPTRRTAPTGTIVYSTYLGGTGADFGGSLFSSLTKSLPAGNYRFAHKSMMEFFVASKLAPLLAEARDRRQAGATDRDAQQAGPVEALDVRLLERDEGVGDALNELGARCGAGRGAGAAICGRGAGAWRCGGAS